MKIIDFHKIIHKLNREPPPELKEYRRQIDEEIRATEFNIVNNPRFDAVGAVEKICQMRLKLDEMYVEWLEKK